jgi:ribosomal protein L32
MAVPKKRPAKSRSKVRYSAYVKRMQKKLINFVERAKRNERGLERVQKDSGETKKKAKVTKIEA